MAGGTTILAVPSGTGQHALNALPTFPRGTAVGDLITLINNGSAVLVLQDRASLTGSQLRLRTSSVALAPGSALQLTWSGSEWVEIARATYPHVVNVADFGADPTGVLDSAPAFLDAINAFSAPGSSVGGTIVVPPGTYRFKSTVHIKKGVHIQGSHISTVIAPETGITPFIFERYNMPRGTTDGGSSDGARMSRLAFSGLTNNHQATVWATGQTIVVGDIRKVGPAPYQGAVVLGETPYRHYRATHGGVTGATGPRSIGDDQVISYHGQTHAFTLGAYVYGATSGAFGIVIRDDNTGTAGQLRLTATSGTFIANEQITDGATPVALNLALADSAQVPAPTDELDGDAVRWEYIGVGAGVRIRAGSVTLADCTFDRMSGSGVHIEAGDPEASAQFVNANGWRMHNVGITSCHGHGLFVNGSDANGGMWDGGAVGGNGGPGSDGDFTGPGFNVYDSSFLGNTFVGIEFYTVGGQGCLFGDSVGGGSTWLGCYQEGTGGGRSIMTGGQVIIGGGLSVGDIRGSGTPTWFGSPVVAISPNGEASRALAAGIYGYTSVPWRENAYRPVGVTCALGGNVYVVATAGTTAASGGPTGTGTGIVDGTCVWDFLAAQSAGGGSVTLGSTDPSIQAAIGFQNPDDVGVAFGSSLKYVPTGAFANFLFQMQYGSSGPNPTHVDGNGIGFGLATNKTYLRKWPMKVPAGKMLVDQFFLGDTRHATTDTAADPTYGIWNPGDRIYYEGAAVASGGREGRICVTAGTADTYIGGRTATADGTATVVVSGAPFTGLIDGRDFHLGDWISVNGGAKRQVQGISNDGLTLTLSGTVAAGSGLSIAFVAPVFKEFGSIA